MRALDASASVLTEPGVYAVAPPTVGAQVSLQSVLTLATDKITLLVRPGVVLSAAATAGVADDTGLVNASSQDFLSIHGAFDATGLTHGIRLLGTRFADVSDVAVVGAGRAGVRAAGVELADGAAQNRVEHVTVSGTTPAGGSGFDTAGALIVNASNNTLSGVAAVNNEGDGIALRVSSGNKLSGVLAANNGHNGVLLDLSHENTVLDVSASHNAAHGVYLTQASHTVLNSVTAVSNRSNGLTVAAAPGSTIAGVVTANNHAHGTHLNGSAFVSLTGVYSTMNQGSGVYVQSSRDGSLSDIITLNNRGDGLGLGD